MTAYLEKNAFSPPFIKKQPHPNLQLAVTIPCFKEEKLLETLESLAACEPPENCAVEVIVLINSAENASPEIKKVNSEMFEKAAQWAENQRFAWPLSFETHHFENLPTKHAGVGLARKIAMDEAARRFETVGNPHGAIACLDADSKVLPNYLKTLHRFFSENPKVRAAGIHYEHPLEGPAFSESVYEAIAKYELHLRYYVHALRSAGLASATQTVGSAMAVRANAYQAQGGMNRRQAGEDFYFLNKFTPLEGFAEIVETMVIPSPRVSDRVPFGTGKAVGEIISKNNFSTYSPLIFKDLEEFLPRTKTLFLPREISIQELPESVSAFLEKENFREKLTEIRRNTSSAEAFEKRFFRWFDPFLAMKFVHHARDNFYPNVPVEEAAKAFLDAKFSGVLKISEAVTARDLLLIFRELDKKIKTQF